MKQNKKIKQYIRLIKKDRDFDYAYLLILERHKLLRMIDSFTNATHPYVGIEHHIREMKLCVELISIILEEDKIANIYMQQFGKHKYTVTEDNQIILPSFDIKIPIHINKNNAYRFNKFWIDKDMPITILMELRRKKAMFLYNKIRNRMFAWWW